MTNIYKVVFFGGHIRYISSESFSGVEEIILEECEKYNESKMQKPLSRTKMYIFDYKNILSIEKILHGLNKYEFQEVLKG